MICSLTPFGKSFSTTTTTCYPGLLKALLAIEKTWEEMRGKGMRQRVNAAEGIIVIKSEKKKKKLC